jgi:radical SAM protein with 4Fe4S-binding SPASM domain
MADAPRVPIDPAAFEKLRRIAPNLSAARRDAEASDWQPRPLPEEIAFKLTNRCDLRCAHCYQWGADGYHHGLAPAAKRGELDLAIVARVLEYTRPARSNVFLWGGEPLVYRDWDGLVDLLERDPRWTSLCTNGTLIGERLPTLRRLGRHLEVSVSLDGFEAEHDAVRGAGSFARAWHGLSLLIARKRAHEFAGEVTVNFVITDPMVPRAVEFVEYLESSGIETVYVSFPWFLATDGAERMDAYFDANFGWARGPGKASWHSYSFRLDPTCVDRLREAIATIDGRGWGIKVRFNPRLDGDDLRPFVLGSDRPAQHKTRCQSTRSRMDVFPDGEVVSCKFFPEFRVGNLHESDVAAVWSGERFNRVRETVARCGLMPACAKCNLLYTRGA